MQKASLVLVLLAGIVLVPGCGKKAPAGKTAGTAAEPTKVETPAVDHLAQALKRAKQDGKNVLVEYYSPSCQYCTQMDDEVYPDDFVKEGLAGLVYVRLTQGKDGKPFEARWGRMGTPTFVVLKPDGTQVGKPVTGFLDVSGMMDLTDWAAKAEGEMPALAPGGS